MMALNGKEIRKHFVNNDIILGKSIERYLALTNVLGLTENKNTL